MNINNLSFQDIVEYLQRYFPVTEEQAEMMMGYCEMRHFDKKVVIVDEGEVDTYLNMVMKGLVRKFVRKGKNEITLQLATEGHIIDSDISFLKQEPSLVVVETIEPTTLVSLSRKKMDEALEKMPGADRMGRQLLLAMFLKKDERHYKLLQHTTRERFVEYVHNHPHMLQRVPQKYLASYLNIKPETFSRLKHLVRKSKP
ncbi:MAG: Crp/Fnr family transcriptional regulator [Chitinophagaceae bacterium]|nr:Crp/Fnr family transcriptional regulator [Chitinophagaceae bacterium]